MRSVSNDAEGLKTVTEERRPINTLPVVISPVSPASVRERRIENGGRLEGAGDRVGTYLPDSQMQSIPDEGQ